MFRVLDQVSLRTAGALVAVIFLLALEAGRTSWAGYEAVEVEPKQQTTNGVETKKAERDFSSKIVEQLPAPNQHAANEASETGENTSESWPPFFGYKIKITDSLLVLFTGLLAWKTWGLDSSTKRLWAVALESERPWFTFEKIHYNTFSGVILRKTNDKAENVIHGLDFAVSWKNTGKSPGIVEITTDYKIVDYGNLEIPTFRPVEHVGVPFMVVGPGVAVISNHKGLNDFEFQAFLSKKIKVAIYSCARYKKALMKNPILVGQKFAVFSSTQVSEWRRTIEEFNCPASRPLETKIHSLRNIR